MNNVLKDSYVYLHKRNDNLKIFYVGIGASEKRAYSKSGRNIYWHNTVKKYGYQVDVIHSNISWEEACFIETNLILLYGRKDLKTGILVNMTAGGDGAKGRIVSEETRHKKSLAGKGRIMSKESIEKIRAAHLGSKRSKEICLKLSECKLGEKNWNYGKKWSEATKEKIKISSLGKKMSENAKLKISKSLIGKPARRRRKVLCSLSGNIFDSVKLAADSIGIKRTTLIMQLRGVNKNKTSLQYYN